MSHTDDTSTFEITLRGAPGTRVLRLCQKLSTALQRAQIQISVPPDPSPGAILLRLSVSGNTMQHWAAAKSILQSEDFLEDATVRLIGSGTDEIQHLWPPEE